MTYETDDLFTTDATAQPNNTVDISTAEAEIFQLLTDSVISHPYMQAAFDKIKAAVARNQFRSEPRHLLVIGNSGCGKSTLCDMIEDEYGGHLDEFTLGAQRQMGALIASVPSPVTPRAMACELLRRVGVNRVFHQNSQELTEELLIQVKRCKVKVVVFDEFQHLLSIGEGKDTGSSKQLREAQDWVKMLVVKSGITFVLAGMPSTAALVRSEPQLARRFTEICRLGPFPRPELTGASTIGSFVADLLLTAIVESKHFDETEWSEQDSTMACRMYMATDGLPSTTKDLVVQACLIAVQRGDRVITLAHFAKAYEETQSNLEEQNAIRRENGEPEVKAIVANPFTVSYQVVQAQVFNKPV